jgi:hypothetical protein
MRRQTLVATRYSQETSGAPRLEAVDAAPGAQHRLLQCVVRVVQRTQDPVAVHVEGLPVRPGQAYECLLVTRSRSRE